MSKSCCKLWGNSPLCRELSESKHGQSEWEQSIGEKKQKICDPCCKRITLWWVLTAKSRRLGISWSLGRWGEEAQAPPYLSSSEQGCTLDLWCLCCKVNGVGESCHPREGQASQGPWWVWLLGSRSWQVAGPGRAAGKYLIIFSSQGCERDRPICRGNNALEGRYCSITTKIAFGGCSWGHVVCSWLWWRLCQPCWDSDGQWWAPVLYWHGALERGGAGVLALNWNGFCFSRCHFS